MRLGDANVRMCVVGRIVSSHMCNTISSESVESMLRGTRSGRLTG